MLVKFHCHSKKLKDDYGPASVPISQGWLALVLSEILGDNKTQNLKGTTHPQPERVKNQVDYHNASTATQILNQLATAVVKLATVQSGYDPASGDKVPLSDFLSLEPFVTALKNLNKKSPPKFDAADSASATLKGIKALAELCSEDGACQKRIADLGALSLSRRILLGDDYEKLAAIEAYDASRIREVQDKNVSTSNDSSNDATTDPSSVRVPPAAHIRRHAGRLVTILSLLPNSKKAIISDDVWCKWLEECASGRVPCNDLKLKSYCRLTLLNVFCSENPNTGGTPDEYPDSESEYKRKCPQFGDALFLLNPELPLEVHLDNNGHEISREKCKDDCYIEEDGDSETGSSVNAPDNASKCARPLIDVVFIHGLRGGPFNSWRIADDKSSTTKAGLVESIDEDAGKEGTCWPREWLAADFPQARLLTVKYKTNLTQWTGASLPLQEVSSMLLRKLIAAGIGSRPVVFVTHSMGGLVVKQMLYQAKLNNYDKFLNNTSGLVCICLVILSNICET
uniref:GPI inositol-deacylase n=1 Tax=Leersia perrieri TaxID=77586 RepID=A0A0D9VQF3_9ORYZ